MSTKHLSPKPTHLFSLFLLAILALFLFGGQEVKATEVTGCFCDVVSGLDILNDKTESLGFKSVLITGKDGNGCKSINNSLFFESVQEGHYSAFLTSKTTLSLSVDSCSWGTVNIPSVSDSQERQGNCFCSFSFNGANVFSDYFVGSDSTACSNGQKFGVFANKCTYYEKLDAPKNVEGCYCKTNNSGDKTEKLLFLNDKTSCETANGNGKNYPGGITDLTECQWNQSVTASTPGTAPPINSEFKLPEKIDQLNKLGTVDPNEIIGRLMRMLMQVAGSIAFLMFVYGGFTYMTASGNAEKEKKSWDIMIWSALGIMIILASWAIVDFVFSAFR